MFTYDVKDRKQVEEDTRNRFEPWPKGEYEFEILDASQTVTGPNSKNPGVPMIKLNLTVYNSTGASRGVFDNLIANQPDKIMAFCDAVGLEYGKPFDVLMLKGKSGRVMLKIQPEREWNGTVYDPSNAVSYYVKRTGKTAATTRPASSATTAAAKPNSTFAASAPAPAEDLDDEIPF
jgi:hypothetical protein